jgi:beta-glucosidase
MVLDLSTGGAEPPPGLDRRDWMKWLAASTGGLATVTAGASAGGAAAGAAGSAPTDAHVGTAGPGAGARPLADGGAAGHAFPADFVWGAATAAYQVEGAAAEDGRGPCVWDMFCRHPGKVWRDQCADVSADHYHRMKEDVGLMRAMGLPAYRFSISWSRVLPEGAGAPNPRGLDFYDRLVDELLGAGIAPWATLYHWDLPLALYHRGGFMNRDVADWFGDYTTLVARRLSDRVPAWMPLNEPQVFIGSGLQLGRHAPGDQLRFTEVMQAAHNTLRCHGRAVQALRASARRPLEIGTAQAGVNRIPATTRPEDVQAARERAFATDPETMYSNALWLDPMVLGHYPADYLAGNRPHLPPVFATSTLADDLKLIAQPLEFVGVNQYQADRVRRTRDGRIETVPYPDGFPITASFEWAVAPETMYYMPKFLFERYRKPIYITENGISVRDWIGVDGQCHDPSRIDFTIRYLRALAQAIADGVPVRGYFHWSLLDNFEWAEGFKHRFGLIHVDYATGTRTPKDSAHFYRDVIASRGARVFAG